jgi:hypothetical protein
MESRHTVKIWLKTSSMTGIMTGNRYILLRKPLEIYVKQGL